MSVEIYTPSVYIPHGGGGTFTKRTPAGVMIANGKCVRDANGQFFPLATSFFWYWWGWKHDQSRTLQNLAEVAPWADEQRILGEVGGQTWQDRVIDPRDSDYVDVGKAATDEAFGRYATRTQLTVFGGGTGANPDEVMKKVKAILRGRLEAFSSVEISNEGNGVDHETRRRLCQELQAEFPGLLVATTSGTGDNWTPEGFDLDIANFATDHSERDRGDEDWRQVRQGCEMMGFPKVKDNNEPPGFESSVAVLHDPLRLAALRLTGILCGMVKYCHHTGAGIRGGGAADLARGRASNFSEYNGSGSNRPDMPTAVRAYRACEPFVPIDAPNWRGVKGHWPDTRLFADMIWSDNSAAYDHGCVRVYGSYVDNAYAEIIFGVRRYVDLTQKMGSYYVKVYDVLTGDLVMDRHVNDGETFRLDNNPSGDSNKAFLVLGNR